MLDLMVDAQTNDLVLVDGDLAPSSAQLELAQRIRAVLGAQRGFWPFDVSWGLPYRQQILVRSPDLNAIAAAVRAALVRVDGVLSVPSCSLSMSGRELAAEIRVASEFGELELTEVIV